jgi:hypothetical protein
LLERIRLRNIPSLRGADAQAPKHLASVTTVAAVRQRRCKRAAPPGRVKPGLRTWSVPVRDSQPASSIQISANAALPLPGCFSQNKTDACFPTTVNRQLVSRALGREHDKKRPTPCTILQALGSTKSRNPPTVCQVHRSLVLHEAWRVHQLRLLVDCTTCPMTHFYEYLSRSPRES